MAKKIKNILNRKQIYAFSALLCFAILIIHFAGFAGGSMNKTRFTESNQLLPANPMIGYAPSAASSKTAESDISLAYVDLTWAELEPQEGVFNWAAIEEDNDMVNLRSQGKHLVFRFILDYPRDEKHMDIPNWLYNKIGGDGTWYDGDYGMGFSPNYGNPTVIEYHKKAIEAMGERWGKDGFIGFIQLGSLGHWGEWHVKYGDGIVRLPVEEVRDMYVRPYMDAFPNAKLLMRRPFKIAKDNGFGVFNDMTGHPEHTQEWLGWLRNGGRYVQAVNTENVVAIPNWWEHGPVGGEFTSALSMNNMLVKNLNRTISLIEESHASFLGPKIADVEESDRNGYDRIRKSLGYRFWISDAEIEGSSSGTKISLTWKNSGIAPMYHKWNSYIYVEDRSGNNITTVKVPLDITTLKPGDSRTVEVDMDGVSLNPSTQNIYLGIVDPMTGRDAVHFAVKGQEHETRLLLFNHRR